MYSKIIIVFKKELRKCFLFIIVKLKVNILFKFYLKFLNFKLKVENLVNFVVNVKEVLND